MEKGYVINNYNRARVPEELKDLDMVVIHDVISQELEALGLEPLTENFGCTDVETGVGDAAVFISYKDDVIKGIFPYVKRRYYVNIYEGEESTKHIKIEDLTLFELLTLIKRRIEEGEWNEKL